MTPAEEFALSWDLLALAIAFAIVVLVIWSTGRMGKGGDE